MANSSAHTFHQPNELYAASVKNESSRLSDDSDDEEMGRPAFSTATRVDKRKLADMDDEKSSSKMQRTHLSAAYTGRTNITGAVNTMKKHEPQDGTDGAKESADDASGVIGGAYSTAAEKMMSKMGYKAGTGLGKHAQGRVDPVEASMQRGRRGLGLNIKGLEPNMFLEWSMESDPVTIDETVDWLPSCKDPVPSLDQLRSWMKIGPRKLTLDDETSFCSEETLQNVLASKSIFDSLEPEEMRKARTRSNTYETIRGAFFLNRAAMKMANMDAVLNFMFTKPKHPDGKPMLGHNDLLYFADVCAGPGGFSEYVLWRSKAEAKGFGMTLKGECDFKLEDFFAGPPEMFEPHYGVGGANGNGDIFNADNQKAFIDFVLENTAGLGVHFVMADGGFSVEGQENIQEILSKQLYLCQFLVAISIIRTGGHFVCKLFDLFTPFSIGLVYLMYRIFDQVSIFKPVTSRPANSERYIICKGLRGDREPVRQYFHEVNLALNKYLVSTSMEDVNEIVPMEYLQNNGPFYEYMCNSNDSLGEIQILNLKKIQAFTRNTNLVDTRQADIRKQLLEKWKVDDELRVAPPKVLPDHKCQDLLNGDDQFLDHVTNQLTLENLRSITSVFDYRCMVTGDHPEKQVFLLGLGRSKVFQRECKAGSRWQKLDNNKLFVELPRDTLLHAEIVTELRGEGTGQMKVNTVHVLDALFLCGKDVRNLHFNERILQVQRFVKCITKPTISKLARVVVPDIYRLEDLSRIFERLVLRKVKGQGPSPRLCYCPQHASDSQFFRPSGVYIIKTVKAPWTMQWSKSQNKKYFFNLHKGESLFDMPKESIASVSDSKQHSYHWTWEGIRLLEEQQGQDDDSKLSKATILEYLHRLMPHR